MTDTEQRDETAEKVDAINAVRSYLDGVEHARTLLINAAGDVDSLDHAMSQYVLARERLNDALDGFDVESLAGVQREREAAAESATDTSAPASDTAPPTPAATEPEPASPPAEQT